MWKGRLQLALVSCGVKLYSALTPAEQVHFHILNRKSNNRIRLVPHDAESGEEAPRDQLVKGFEFEKGHHVVIDPAEVEKLRPARNKAIEIGEFVDAREFDTVYCDRPYYLAPDDAGSAETYCVIRDALAARGRIGIGRVVLQSRERAVALEPHGRGMVMTTLLTRDEVRDDKAFFDEIGDGKLDPEMIDLAALVIGKKTGPLEVSEFRDSYQDRLRALVDAKIEHRDYVAPKARPTAQIIDLKEALRRAAAEGGREPALREAAGDKPTRPPAKKAARRKAAPKKKRRG